MMNSTGDTVQLDEHDLRFIDAAIRVLGDPDGDDRQEPVHK
jgi:hypothetical protein